MPGCVARAKARGQSIAISRLFFSHEILASINTEQSTTHNDSMLSYNESIHLLAKTAPERLIAMDGSLVEVADGRARVEALSKPRIQRI